MSDTADFLVIGGGVVGLTVALELRRRHGAASVTVLEKEPQPGAHASGRNSGVLHAGFYYTPDSLKARLTRDGCAAWTAYHREHGPRPDKRHTQFSTRTASEQKENHDAYRTPRIIADLHNRLTDCSPPHRGQKTRQHRWGRRRR